MKNGIWNNELAKVLDKFKTPGDVQSYLSKIPYYDVKGNNFPVHSPLQVVKAGKAFCSEGAFFAAAALRYMGYQPLVLMIKAARDEDHFITVFKKGKRWGAISKADYLTLRYREPVYNNVRELVMSYFDFYFRRKYKRKTLRAYTNPVNLKRFDKHDWMNTEKDLSFICYYFDKLKTHKVLTRRMIHRLRPVENDLIKGTYIK